MNKWPIPMRTKDQEICNRQKACGRHKSSKSYEKILVPNIHITSFCFFMSFCLFVFVCLLFNGIWASHFTSTGLCSQVVVFFLSGEKTSHKDVKRIMHRQQLSVSVDSPPYAAGWEMQATSCLLIQRMMPLMANTWKGTERKPQNIREQLQGPVNK